MIFFSIEIIFISIEIIFSFIIIIIIIIFINFSRSFDTLMIFYLRYSLYEYILENKNKVVSKDFPVLLGNLLPIKYQIENQLNIKLKMKTIEMKQYFYLKNIFMKIY